MGGEGRGWQLRRGWRDSRAGWGRTAKRYWDIRIKDRAKKKKKKAKVPQAQSWCYHSEHLHTIHAWEPKRGLKKTVPKNTTHLNP